MRRSHSTQGQSVTSYCRLTSPTGERIRMRSKVSCDCLPSYIKATRPIFEIFKMAGYFPDIPRIWRMEIEKLIEGADIVRFKAQRIRWLGHIQRMDQARPTRKLSDLKPMGTRPVGRPRQWWQEDVMGDLKNLKVKNLKETAKDRRTWRDLAEKAKTHRGL